MTMDISKEAEALNDLLRNLIQQRTTLQLQQEHEEKRINGLQDKIDQEDIAHKAAIESMYQKRRDLKESLIGIDGRVIQNYIAAGALPSRQMIEDEIESLEKNITSHQVQREKKRQQDAENVGNEKKNRKELYEAQERRINSEEASAKEKEKKMIKWECAHTAVRQVSPLRLILEFHLPILLGIIAIGTLIHLMLYFPPPAPPPSLPDL